ncbi:MAG: ubiquitin-conjugating enzyme E2 [archaeon]|nr:ubiquitin-conjugating enzyme E2 [archaeon]
MSSRSESLANKRLLKDLRDIEREKPEGISATPCETDDQGLFHWHAIIFGPDDTQWEGGIFQLDMRFDHEYPTKPPTIKFVTPIFHPNVYGDGSICLDILQNQWSPIYTITAILQSIRSLLTDPNPASPANAEAAKIFREDIREYNRRVAEVVTASWQSVGDTLSSDSESLEASDEES